MYYLLHINQLHASALFIGHLQVDEDGQRIVLKYVVEFFVINNTYLFHQIVVLDIRYIPI